MQHAKPRTREVRIAIAGKMGSGKSALANELARALGARRVSFATKVREVVRDLYGPGNEKNRHLMTGVGMGLRAVDADTWVNAVRRTVARYPDASWVLDDLRFPNELNALRADGWVVVRLAVDAETRSERILRRCGGDADAARGQEAYAGHASETALDLTPDFAFDAAVRGDGTVCRHDGRLLIETDGTARGIADALLSHIR